MGALRVPYLTIEQIIAEDEGKVWSRVKHHGLSLSSEDKSKEIVANKVTLNHAILKSGTHIKVLYTGTFPYIQLFSGECTDINEFRRITKKYLNR